MERASIGCSLPYSLFAIRRLPYGSRIESEGTAMPKGYWIARVDVTDPEAYRAYVAANGVAFAKFGGRFLVRGGKFETMEGNSRQRNVVIEFASYEAALACWNSPEYKKAHKLRTNASMGDLVIIEGYEGDQPGEG
jgi:uncharacterized protein (DUF1330 family)